MTSTITGDAIDVAVDTLAFIKANPEQWNQRSWGSCFAGHFARLDSNVQLVAGGVLTCPCGCGDTSEDWVVTTRDGQAMSVYEWFVGRLGVHAGPMTTGDRTVEELEAAVIALKEDRSVEDAMMATRIRSLLRAGSDVAP